MYLWEKASLYHRLQSSLQSFDYHHFQTNFHFKSLLLAIVHRHNHVAALAADVTLRSMPYLVFNLHLSILTHLPTQKTPLACKSHKMRFNIHLEFQPRPRPLAFHLLHIRASGHNSIIHNCYSLPATKKHIT